MNLQAKFGYMRKEGIDPSMISIDGAINMAVTPILCGLEYGESYAAKPFNLTKVGQTFLWEFATWPNFTQKKNIDHNQITPNT
jgi:hypothetical protein